jgi:hypothetical protein
MARLFSGRSPAQRNGGEAWAVVANGGYRTAKRT